MSDWLDDMTLKVNNDCNLYQRRTDVEKMDCGNVIIDTMLSNKYRIINLYRIFSPNNLVSQFEYFKSQLEIIKKHLRTLQ